MSAERPNIIQVKNDVIQVGLPYFEGTPETYLTSAIAAAGVTATVKDNLRFAEGNYTVLGVGQQAEIKRITGAVTDGTSLTIAACTFPHPVGTRVKLSLYDQVEIYGSTSASDAAPTLIGSAVKIDVRTGYTQIKASTTYAYYYARFKDSNAGTYSSYSDSVLAAGLSSQSRGEIKKEFLSVYNLEIDDLCTDDWMNRTINRWQRELLNRRTQWSCLRDSTSTAMVEDQQKYPLPSDIFDNDTRDSIISVKYYNYPALTYADQGVFDSYTSDHIGTTLGADIGLADVTVTLTDGSNFGDSGTIQVQGDEIAYTSKSSNTLSGVTGITATHSSGDEAWQTRTAGTPQYYTIDNGYIKLYPMPNESGYDLLINYWQKFTDLSDDADETLFTHPENCLKYMNWQLAIRNKLPISDQRAKEEIWREELDDLVANDGEFRDINLTPVEGNIYVSPY